MTKHFTYAIITKNKTKGVKNKTMKITQQDIDKIIIFAYYTEKGNVWIDGIMGGGIEYTDAGRKYHNVENAKKHYCKKYFEYCKKYTGA